MRAQKSQTDLLNRDLITRAHTLAPAAIRCNEGWRKTKGKQREILFKRAAFLRGRQ
jgi:CII-binding regulator of phage lambda lysogenization HflD